MTPTFSTLGDISIEQFLKEYWQQKPLLIRQAIPGFKPPLSADELAGLALEDWVESRLVIEQGATPWELRNGPFTEHDFARLPETNWTLLVQAVDQIVPDVSELLDYFRFIPNWRLDDIMISYAVDQGSVGPHFDYYDVFLLQAEGTRTWHIGQTCNANSPRIEGTPLNILAEFESCQHWELEPGDMLYLPPKIAHWGIANGECMTYSIGFRAPSHADILGEFSAEVASHLSNDMRFSDAQQRQLQNPGEIQTHDIEQVARIIRSFADDTKQLTQWFGRYMTQTKYEQDPADGNLAAAINQAASELSQRLQQTDEQEPLVQTALTSRLAYSGTTLFCNGEAYPATLELADYLTAQRQFTHADCQAICNYEGGSMLLTKLIAKGALEWADDTY